MLVVLGEIVRAVGLRGEIKIQPSADFDEAVLCSSFARFKTPGGVEREAHLMSSRWKGVTLIAKFSEIEDRDAAEASVGSAVGFREEDYDLPGFPRPDSPLPFVYQDLTVVTDTGETLGRVVEVLKLPASLVLRVMGDRGEVLVPVIPPVVRELRRSEGRLVIELMEGLLGDESS